MDGEGYIRRALELAERGRGIVSPNPMVGAVVVDDGRVVGEGWHAGPGTPHAEADALDRAGKSARGATLYVNLEPCNHYGRTPPCTEAIASSGVSRVVASIPDPNPAVDGGGFKRLRASGVSVETGLLAADAERLNEAFLKHVRTGIPFVTLKLAATLDGKIAARDGSSTWITSEASRAEAHRLRAIADAVMVGSGTVLADDPRLTVRRPDYEGAPVLRVAIDSTGRIPPTARLFDGEAPAVIATTDRAPIERREAWRTAGADVLVLGRDADGRVALVELLAALGKHDVQSVLVEGGSTLAGALVRDGALDKLVIFLAPKILGGAAAPGMVGGDGLPTLAHALTLEISGVRRIGPDIEVEAYVQRDH